MRVVLGVGGRPDAAAGELLTLAAAALAEHGLDPTAVRLVATLDRRAGAAGVQALAAASGTKVQAVPVETLAAQACPTPSQRVLAAVGSPSVAEAAVLACGGGLLGPRHASRAWTVAVGALPAAGLTGAVDPTVATPVQEDR
ncbi:MAG: cobalamin biosynthesis protein [Oryzihumus sp.]